MSDRHSVVVIHATGNPSGEGRLRSSAAGTGARQSGRVCSEGCGGNLVGSYNELAELMALTANGQVRLHTCTYPLGAVNDALDDLVAGRLRGRGILVPDRLG